MDTLILLSRYYYKLYNNENIENEERIKISNNLKPGEINSGFLKDIFTSILKNKNINSNVKLEKFSLEYNFFAQIYCNCIDYKILYQYLNKILDNSKDKAKIQTYKDLIILSDE